VFDDYEREEERIPEVTLSAVSFDSSPIGSVCVALSVLHIGRKDDNVSVPVWSRWDNLFKGL
jgi:hypothetical protein